MNPGNQTSSQVGKSRSLTKRELEVCRWIADGKANKEIAIIMGISYRTVEKHVEHILQKLGMENRMQILIHILDQQFSAKVHKNGTDDVNT